MVIGVLQLEPKILHFVDIIKSKKVEFAHF